MAMYWLIATPNEGKGTQENRRILDETSAKKKLSDNFLFDIPQLKVGTIDNLMALSDELSKYDVLVGGTAKKIERAYIDTWKAEPTESEAENKDGKVSGTAKAPELKVNDVSPQEFVEQFKWNAVRYPNKRATLRAMVETIVKDTSKTDSELKKFTTEFNDIRNTVSALERKETGTLMVRPLGPYVQKQHVVESDFLSTLMLVVPKVKEIEFLQQYEMYEDLHKEKEAKLAETRLKEEQLREAKNAELKTAEAAALGGAGGEKKRDTSKPVEIPTAAQTIPKEVSATDRAAAEEKRLNDEKEKKRSAVKNIVPRSAIKLAEDTEFVLYRVVVLKKGVDLYKTICRERRITVRDFKYDPAQDEIHKKNMENLEKLKKKQWRNLVLWCKTTFSEVFSAWIHIKAMRTFVEAVLRYGLPVDFTATLMLPAKGQEKRLRETLKALYGKLASANLTQQLDSAEADLSGLGQDFYPYVYLTINLAEAP